MEQYERERERERDLLKKKQRASCGSRTACFSPTCCSYCAKHWRCM